MYNILQKYFSRLVFLIKILIISGAYYVISEKVLHEAVHSSALWRERFDAMGTTGFSFVLILFACTVVNWLLEILRWRVLAGSLNPISFESAVKQSLSSLTASLLTPNRIGEYGAKAIYYDKSQRPRVLMLNFIGNAIQMLITVVFGLIGILILNHLFSFNYGSLFLPIGIGLSMAAVLVWFLLRRARYFKRIQNLIAAFKRIPLLIYKNTVLYSAARYLIFSHQFYLFLIFFGFDLDYTLALPLIMSMYLISSVIPGFVLFDWLIKGSVAVTLFGWFGADDMMILSITASMWIFNFALPALLGSYYVFTFNRRPAKLRESRVAK